MKKKGCGDCSARTSLFIKYLLTMKLVILLMLALSAQSFATGYSQGISLQLEKVQLKKVFKIIEEQGTFRFVYRDAILPKDKRVSITVDNASLDEVMDKVLQNTLLTYKKLNDNLIVITNEEKENITISAAAEPVSGLVSNSKGEPLPGVTVQEKGTNNITVTKENGAFSLNTTAANPVLIFSYVGYQSQEVAVPASNMMSVTLQETEANLNEVVVVGYGSRKKKDITGAVSVVNSKDIEKSTALTPELAMQGQMAGVNVTSSGSNPTARPTVRIRGVGTFAGNGAADPLYIIDGVPLVEGGAGAVVDKVNDPTRRGPINLYAIINPNDIESITVLKDASASAIYGVRAANGVVLVTTKTGKKGRVRVDVDATYGTQKVPKTYSVLNTQQYVKFYTDAYNAYPDLSGTTPIPIDQAQYFSPLWNPSNADYIGNRGTYDWQDAVINSNSKNQNYNIRASGGSDNTTYNFSVGYAKNDGAFIGYKADRYSISTNVISKIGKYIEAGVNLRGVQQTTQNPVDVNLDIWKAAPWQAIYDPNGPYGYSPLWKLNQPITPSTFDITTAYSRQYVAYGNVLGTLATGVQNTYTDQTGIGNGYITIQPIAGLRIKGNISAQQTTITNKTWAPFDAWWFGENPSNPYTGVKDTIVGTKPGNVGIGNNITTSITKSLNIDYLKSFGNHNINITLDASQQEYSWTGNGTSRYIISNDPTLRYFSTTGNERGYSELRAKYALIGYLGRVTYNYKGRYYAEAVVRRDGSSRFAPGHQWGTFPSGSLAWRISQEKFMNNISFINDLKIRGGYGLLGNEQTTGGWAYLSVAGVVPPSYNLGSPNTNAVGIAYTTFPNQEITWEKLRSLNIGFDAVLLNNTVTVTVDYYNKVNKGIIQSVALTPTTGISVPADLNVADVINRGIEFQVGYNKTFGKVGVNAMANLTTQHNEVSKLYGGTALRGAGLEEGLPIGFIYGYKVGGIFQDQGEIDKLKQSTTDASSKEQKPGDYYFQNLYGPPTAGSTLHNPEKDSVVNENDQTYLGKTIPGYFYGFTLGATFMNFDVSAFFQGRGDVQAVNYVRMGGEGMNGYGRNILSTVLNAWTPDNHSTSMPRAVYNDPNNNTRMSDRWVENAGYFRLQNLQVGYTLPKKVLGMTAGAIQNLRIYLTGINLFTVTKYSGLDPENDLFPSTRQFLAGIKASF